MQKTSPRLRRKATALAVVDLQERLVPAICNREQRPQNTLRLIKGAAVLGLPLLVTEQYRKGLAFFELLETAEADEFKFILALVK